MPPPVDCPQCGKPLYALARLRPKPGMASTAKLLMLASGLTGTVIYFAALMIVRYFIFIPTTIMGIVALQWRLARDYR
jgi:hypothetical protein